MAALVAVAAAGLFMTTTSSPANAVCCWRKDSLTILFIRFRAVARRQCFFEIASPSFACSESLSRHNTVKRLSRLRVALSNTRPKAAASRSRLSFVNRLLELLVNPGLLAARATLAGYGVSRARPLARRRFRIRRPALVAMRARNPWVRARLILLGWYVRFMTFPGIPVWGEFGAKKRPSQGRVQ